jgi:hypothetical protein
MYMFIDDDNCVDKDYESLRDKFSRYLKEKLELLAFDEMVCSKIKIK